MIRRLLALGAGVCLLPMLDGCGEGGAIVQVAGETDTLTFTTDVSTVDIRQGSIILQQLTLDVGETVTLTVTALNALGFSVGGIAPVWASSDSSVATITPGASPSSAVIMAIAPGSAQLSASVDSVSAVLPTLVQAPGGGGGGGTPGLGRLTVSPPTLFMSNIDDTRQLSVTATDSLGAPMALPSVTWQTTDQAVAAVNSNGLVRAAGFGTAYVKALSGCCTPDSARVDIAAPSTDLEWFSDWRTGIGDTQIALFDGGNFNRRLCGGIVDGSGFHFDDLLDVVSAPGGVFPTGIQNVLRITYHQTGSAACNMVAADQAWQSPQVGEYLFSRVYMYADIAVGEEAVGHWFHHGSNAAGNDYPFFWTGQTTSVAPDSTYRLWAGVGPAGGVGGRGHGSFGMNVKTHRLYRLELRIHRTNPDSMRFQARIYDGNGGLVATGRNFVCESGPCGFASDTLGQYKASYTGSRGFNSIEVGNNGPAQQPAGFQYRYVGGVAIRVSANPNDWIGGYPVLGQEN